jgi:hypothetical protein
VDAARQPFRSRTWLAGTSVVLTRTEGDPARLRRLGSARFEAAVRREVFARQGKKPRLRIVRLLLAACTDPRGVTTHRPGMLERVLLLLDDFRDTGRRLAETEARMVAVLDELQLTVLVTSIVGLSALGSATILAETGDLTRFASARAVVKHSGLAPREKSSGTYTGRTKLKGKQTRTARGRVAGRSGEPNAPSLSMPPNLTHLTSRGETWASPRGDCRRAVAPTARGGDHRPTMGPGHHRPTMGPGHHGPTMGPGHHRPTMGPGHRGRRANCGDRTGCLGGGSQAGGRGEPPAALRNHGYLAGHHGQPPVV